MMKTRVKCTGVNQIGETKLPNVSKSLKIGMFDQIKNQLTSDGNETINRVVDNLSFVQAL